MNTHSDKDLDRRKLYNDLKRQHGDASSYKLYVSRKDDPELNRKIKSGEVKLTLQDLIDKGEQALSEPS
ncbi:MAG: hypothetical protein J4G18_13345 [Anaerolineae bacterium]|nr:hypothetical protein [Anaerolineae bacterium]